MQFLVNNYVSYHHNWYDHCDSRMPRVRTSSNVHVYNNFYDGVAKYGIGSTLGSSIFSEANYFLNTKIPMMSSKQGTDALGDGTFSGENGGIIKSWADVMVFTNAAAEALFSFIPYSQNSTSFDAYVASSRNETVPSSVVTLSGGTSYSNFDTASGFYTYNVQSAEDAMVTVQNYAGRINGGDLKWTFTDEDDLSYAVNTELKSALTNYTTPIVSIGGDSSGDAGGGGEAPSCNHTATTTTTTPATCTSTGSTIVTCNLCGAAVSNTVIPMTSHNYVDGSCSVCGKLDASSCTHRNTTSNVTAPTCTAGGYTTYTCTDCGYSYTANETAAKGHTPGVGATCTTAQTCTVCSAVITAALGHSYQNGVCTVCGAQDLASQGYAHNFTENGKTSTFYTITGNLATGKGTVTYNGLTLTQCLKIESSTNISFTATASGTLTLVFVEAATNIKIDGTKVTSSSNVITVTVTAGNHTITKADTMNLFYMVYTPDGPHTHNYTSNTTEATCTTEGSVTYSCTCGDSYTETIAATGHSFYDGVCTKCGSDGNDFDNNEGGSGDSGDSGTTAESYIHNFYDDGWTSTFFTFAGGKITDGKHGTYTYDFGNGTEKLNWALKFDSGGSVVFTPTADGTLTIAVASKDTGRTFTLNGTQIAKITTANTLVVVTVEVTADTEYTLKRGSGESGLYYIAYVPNPVDDGGSTEPLPPAGGNQAEPGFSGASLAVGSDLSIRYHIVPEDGVDIANYSVRFTANGKTTLVESGVVENGKYVFSFCGIAPQCMGDSIKAELLINGEVVDVVDGFSVKQYVINAIAYLTGDEYDTLHQFLSDMLHYGAAAQNYVSYKTDALVTDGVAGLRESSAVTPTAEDNQRSIDKAGGANTDLAKFTAAGVRFDYDNKIFVKFTTTDVSKVSVKIGGIALEIQEAGDGKYVAYSEGISALEFGETVSFQLYYNGSLIQTLNYTVNSYAYGKNGDTQIGALAIALYRYGKSAEAYNTSKNS